MPPDSLHCVLFSHIKQTKPELIYCDALQCDVKWVGAEIEHWHNFLISSPPPNIECIHPWVSVPGVRHYCPDLDLTLTFPWGLQHGNHYQIPRLRQVCAHTLPEARKYRFDRCLCWNRKLSNFSTHKQKTTHTVFTCKICVFDSSFSQRNNQARTQTKILNINLSTTEFNFQLTKNFVTVHSTQNFDK